MKRHNSSNWWNIFTTERPIETDDTCPPVPVSAGQAWQKDLVNLYCPCKSDPAALECRPTLI